MREKTNQARAHVVHFGLKICAFEITGSSISDLILASSDATFEAAQFQNVHFYFKETTTTKKLPMKTREPPFCLALLARILLAQFPLFQHAVSPLIILPKLPVSAP